MKKKYIKGILLATCLSIAIASNSQIINTIAGNGNSGYSGDGGPATAAEFAHNAGMGLDASGNLYIADYNNQRIRIVDASGNINTFAGNGSSGFSGDGGLAIAAQVSSAFGVTTDGLGNVYIADGGNNRVRIVDASGIINTIAGNGIGGYSGDGGQATDAEMSFPEFIATDASGNIYIADNGNSAIRMINAAGVISTIAGNGTSGYSGDGGQATDAEISNPGGISISGGNIYFADESNNAIRMIDASGVISTIAGNGVSGYSGDGGPATAGELQVPYDVSVDGFGDIYIADLSNSAVRVIDPIGNINTFAGNGTPGYTGDGGAATAAELQYPSGVKADLSTGNLYIGDENNNVVRVVTNIPAVTKEILSASNVNVYPNPTSGLTAITGLKQGQVIELYNSIGQKISSTIAQNSTIQIDLSSMANGIYLVRILGKDGSIVSTKKVVKAE